MRPERCRLARMLEIVPGWALMLATVYQSRVSHEKDHPTLRWR